MVGLARTAARWSVGRDDGKRNLIAQSGKEVIRNFFDVALGKDSGRIAGSQNVAPVDATFLQCPLRLDRGFAGGVGTFVTASCGST